MTPDQLAEMGLAINRVVSDAAALRLENQLLREALARCRTAAFNMDPRQVGRIVETVMNRVNIIDTRVTETK